MRIERRFCGPLSSGNGGYTAGRVASLIAGPAEVTLRAPPPLDTELSLSLREGKALLEDDQGRLLAEGIPSAFELELPDPIGWQAAREASQHYIGFGAHPYPSCFVCGPSRASEQGKGLELFPGPVPLRSRARGRASTTAAGRQVVAAPFLPPADLGDEQGLLRPEFVWAALDCPSWFGHASYAERVPQILLGRLSVSILRRPQVVAAAEAGAGHEPSQGCVVLGWGLGQEGRRITCGSALFDARGECLAFGKAIRIELKAA